MSLLDLAAPCSRCGCEGIHACTGKPLPPPTPEEEARLTEVLKEVFDRAREREVPRH